MTCIYSLPDDILFLIIEKLIEQEVDKPWQFKKNLRLLSICSRLRQAALPLAYKYLFVTYGTNRIELVISNLRRKYDQPIDIGISTNLDLAKHAGNNLTQTLFIEMQYMTDLAKELTTILKMLNGSVHNVKLLKLTLKSYNDSNQDSQPEDIVRVAYDLAKMLPRVEDLEVYANREPGKAICGYIADNYAHQLLSLHSTCPIQTSNYFAKLKWFHIDITGDYQLQLLKLNPKTLKHLIIKSESIGIDFLASNEVVLPRLEQLSLISLDMRPNPRPLKLVLPQLKYYINNIPCPILAKATLPEHIKLLNVRSDCATYKTLSKAKLPNAVEVSLSIAKDEQDTDVVLYMNQTLSNIKHCKKASLHIDNVSVRADCFTSAHVTNLYITSQIEPNTVISLLNRLPRLKSLSLEKVQNLVGIFDDSLDSNPHNQAFKISYLSLCFDGWDCDQKAEFIVYLILRMPLLRKTSLHYVSKMYLFYLLSPYVADYPHIINVMYSFNMRRAVPFSLVSVPSFLF
ncbi:hypothetical protein BX667DRAFT_523352 [Coemansia mojavensis]|nr:hypothetical protein BX667DRAFT_523352 [Coemansia mojavensis]